MDKDWKREQALEKAYKEWRERENRKLDEAMARGDNDAVARHTNNARRYDKMRERGLDRQEDLLRSGASVTPGCLLGLVLMPYHLVIGRVKARTHHR